MTWCGRLLHIHIAPAASAPMQELAEATLVPGRGIEGDRYFKGIGTYSPKPDVREVTLIEMEVLEAMARGDPSFPGEKVELSPMQHRRNLNRRRAAQSSRRQALQSRRDGADGRAHELPMQ